jgi:hypothetical protein
MRQYHGILLAEGRVSEDRTRHEKAAEALSDRQLRGEGVAVHTPFRQALGHEDRPTTICC